MAKVESRFAEIERRIAVTVHNMCTVCAWLDLQPAEDRDYLTALLRRPLQEKGHAYIAQVIHEDGAGPKFSPKTVANHRANHLGQ